MTIKELQNYAQELFNKGVSEADIKNLVSAKISEGITDDEGNAVEVKDFNFKFEEVEEEDAEALDINITKAVKKAVSKKTDKNALPFRKIESVKEVPFGSFESKRQAEAFAKLFVPKHVLEKFNNEKALTTYQNITTDADGGSFDPITVNGILTSSVAKYNSYIEDTLQVPVYNSSATFIDHTSDATSYVLGETTAGTESKPGNTTRTVTLKKVMTLCPVTNEVFRFGTLAEVGQQTLDSMANAQAKKLQHLIFTADGTNDTTDGQITGVIDAITDVSGNKTIYDVAGTWGTLDSDDVSLIVAKTADYANTDNFAWYCNKNMWGYLEGLARSLGGNSYMIQVGQKPVPMLFGYPVKFVNQMPSAFIEDQVGLLFGDLSHCVATAADAQTYVDTSNEFYFNQDVTVLRMIKHMGVNVYAPGTNAAEGSIIAVRFGESS